MSRVVYPRLGAPRSEVLVGPQFGLDTAVVRVGPEMVMVSTTDPISFIPSITPGESARLSLHLLASDLTTSGFSPQYGLFDLNLPPQMKDSELTEYWKAFHNECSRLEVSIVGGHTGRFEGCDYTVIGGGVLWAIGPEDRYLVSNMATDGDDLILTKGAAIETTAVLAHAFPRSVKKALGSRLFDRAWGYLDKVSTVKDALSAASVGVRKEGVTAMHDATEGGVLSALMEIAIASRLGLRIDAGSILVSEETLAIGKLFRIDPLISLSEGSLAIASKPFATTRVLKALSSKGIAGSVVGRLVSKEKGMRISKGRVESKIVYSNKDPYWRAYSKATLGGWS